MAAGHYENFPVASLLLPRRLRPAVHAIYRFARSADDIADEGDATPAQRLEALATYRAALQACEEHREHALPGPMQEVFVPLAQAMRAHGLPWEPCSRLLSAFEQDVRVQRYHTLIELLDYCSRSADPVGRLMLGLYAHTGTPETLAQADAICTGLQLTNFCQDVAIDWQRGRLYIPLEDMAQHGLPINTPAPPPTPLHSASPPFTTPTETTADATFYLQDLAAWRQRPEWASLMATQVNRARTRLLAGKPLAKTLGGRIGWELRLVVQGGLRILERVDAVRGNVFDHRPVLGAQDWVSMFWRTLAS